jgi:hypothetical protein
MVQDNIRDIFTPDVLQSQFPGPLADLIGELLITLVANTRQTLENSARLIRVILALFHCLRLETSAWFLQHDQLMKVLAGNIFVGAFSTIAVAAQIVGAAPPPFGHIIAHVGQPVFW